MSGSVSHMQTEQTWLTRAEAAVRAGVDVRTIDRWIQAGHLTRYRAGAGKKLGFAVQIRASELDALLQPMEERTA